MKKLPISVTDAVRNFADCVNRARYQNLSFVLRKNGAPVGLVRSEGLCFLPDIDNGILAAYALDAIMAYRT